MNPLLLAALAGGGAGLLFGGPKQPSFADLVKMFGPGALGKNAEEIYGLMASSPEFRASLSRTNIGGQQLGQSINTNLARAGLGGTGVGAVGSALGESAGGFAREGLIGGLHQKALGEAGNLNELLANLFLNTRQKTSPLQQLSGATLSAIGPEFLKSIRRPAGGANSAPNIAVDDYWWRP